MRLTKKTAILFAAIILISAVAAVTAVTAVTAVKAFARPSGQGVGKDIGKDIGHARLFIEHILTGHGFAPNGGRHHRYVRNT